MVDKIIDWLIKALDKRGLAVVDEDVYNGILSRIRELEITVVEHGERLDAHAQQEKKADEFTDVFREWLNGGDRR